MGQNPAATSLLPGVRSRHWSAARPRAEADASDSFFVAQHALRNRLLVACEVPELAHSI